MILFLLLSSFIGELFKLQMLTENIMLQCLEMLLSDRRDEESLECLCRLLTTIGKELDAKVRFSPFFTIDLKVFHLSSYLNFCCRQHPLRRRPIIEKFGTELMLIYKGSSTIKQFRHEFLL